MARYEDVLVGGEGCRDYIQDLWSKLVEREQLDGLLLLHARRRSPPSVAWTTSVAPFASTCFNASASAFSLRFSYGFYSPRSLSVTHDMTDLLFTKL